LLQKENFHQYIPYFRNLNQSLYIIDQPEAKSFLKVTESVNKSVFLSFFALGRSRSPRRPHNARGLSRWERKKFSHYRPYDVAGAGAYIVFRSGPRIWSHANGVS